MVGTVGGGNTETTGPRDPASAEFYLRIQLEEVLAARVPDTSLAGALRALEGVGLLGAEVAERIAHDLQLAIALRGGPAAVRAQIRPIQETGPSMGRSSGARTVPATVGVGPLSVALPGAVLHIDGIFSDGPVARIEGRLVLAGGSAPDPDRAPPVASLVVTDDVGTEYHVAVLAEPGAEGFSAVLRPTPPPRASWLELDGGEDRRVRMVLARSPQRMLKARSHGLTRAEQYLWGLIVVRLARLILDGTVDRDGDAGPAIDALVATGVIGPDDHTAAQATLTDAVAVGFDDGADLHEGIRSVLDARDQLGRRGVWSALSPEAILDDLHVRVDVVTADEVSLTVHGLCRPWPTPPWAPMYVTAADDLGGWYVGVAQKAGPDAYGDIETDPSSDPIRRDPAWTLLPSLDPAAGQLTLTYTGPTESVSFRLELE